MSQNKRILLAAGGTGGHFFPALATANELQKEGFEVHFSTDKRCMKYIPDESTINFKIIDLYIRTGSMLAKLLLPFKIFAAIMKALLYIIRLKPSIIIGFGGYPSFPTLLVCKIFAIPIILHEQNRFLGRVNRFFARTAKLVAFSYEKYNQDDVTSSKTYFNDPTISSEYVGDIVREDIKKIKISHDFSNNPIRIFIFGGSQGSKTLTNAIPAAMRIIKQSNSDFKCFITHQVPENNKQFVSNTYKSLDIKHKVADFFHNMDEIYKQTDLVISRSGASTIAELSAIGLPAIFVPLPFAAENHQYENAKFIEKLGGGWTLSEGKNLAQELASKIIELNNDRTKLKSAATKIGSRKSDGTTALVATVKKIVSS